MDTLIPKLRIPPVSLPLSAPLKKFFTPLFFYFLAVLGLHCCTLAFSSCSEWGLLSCCNVQASHCSGFSCWGTQALGHPGSRAKGTPSFWWSIFSSSGFPGCASGKGPTCQCRRHKRHGFDPWVGKISLEEGMATYSSILAWTIPWTEEPGQLFGP